MRPADHEQQMLQLIRERDNAQAWADKLAQAIAVHFAADEHSNVNNPWAEALDVIESAVPAEVGQAEAPSAPCLAEAERHVLDDLIDLARAVDADFSGIITVLRRLQKLPDAEPGHRQSAGGKAEVALARLLGNDHFVGVSKMIAAPRERVYLSGPMTGLPDDNRPAFNNEARRLRAAGYRVVNPAEVNPGQSLDWHQCVRKDMALLPTCDTLALLPGWEHSDGAHLELHVAHRLRMRIVRAEELA